MLWNGSRAWVAGPDAPLSMHDGLIVAGPWRTKGPPNASHSSRSPGRINHPQMKSSAPWGPPLVKSGVGGCWGVGAREPKSKS
jgi:hypothetical protein